MKIGVLIFLLVLKLGTVSQAKLSNSVYAMETLIKPLEAVIRSIEEYLKEEKNQIKFTESHINDSLKELEKAEEDQRHIWNSVYGYSYLNRVGRGFTFIRNITKQRTGYFKDISLGFPTTEDMIGAAQGMVRMQVVYRMNIAQLANGTLSSNFRTPMTSSDCYYLSLVERKTQGYSGQLLWLREALRKHYAEPCSICHISEEHLMWKISQAYYDMKEYNKALEWVKSLLTMRPLQNDTELHKLKLFLEYEIDKGMDHRTKAKKLKVWKQPSLKEEFGGCYRHDELDAHTLKSLRCEYDIRSSFLRYSPAKAEQLAAEPRVVMYHDAISHQEIESLKKLARLQLKDVRLVTIREGKVIAQSTEDHTAKFTELNRGWEITQRLLRRAANTAGLSLGDDAAVPIQGFNYGIGGAHAKHVDYLGPTAQVLGPAGDRLIAFIYFLSDVEQGGALLFPLLGVKVYPKKGAAVAFTLLHPSGEGDLAVMNIACPVIRGDKWIVKSWFLQQSQDTCPNWHYDDGIMTAEKYARWLPIHKEITDVYLKRNSRGKHSLNNFSKNLQTLLRENKLHPALQRFLTKNKRVTTSPSFAQ